MDNRALHRQIPVSGTRHREGLFLELRMIHDVAVPVDEDVSFDSVFSPDSFPLRLSRFSPLLNMSEIARRLGIAQPLMAAYVSGAKRRAAILAELAAVGAQ